jgi:hypothetical protein
MAWVVERRGARGTTYKGSYRDPDGRERSAGSYPSRREALRAANREEQKVLARCRHLPRLPREGVAAEQAP